MKCFNHFEADAVGVCRSCGRALCHACIAEVGLSCSCKNRCESTVASLNDIAERNKTVYQKSSAVYWWMGFFLLLTGGMVGLSGIIVLLFSSCRAESIVPLLFSVLFIGAGVASFGAARRFLQK